MLQVHQVDYEQESLLGTIDIQQESHKLPERFWKSGYGCDVLDLVQSIS